MFVVVVVVVIGGGYLVFRVFADVVQTLEQVLRPVDQHIEPWLDPARLHIRGFRGDVVFVVVVVVASRLDRPDEADAHWHRYRRMTRPGLGYFGLRLILF